MPKYSLERQVLRLDICTKIIRLVNKLAIKELKGSKPFNA